MSNNGLNKEIHALSIVIPCYNCAECLPKMVQSLLNQALEMPVEIILVNDGSQDEGKTLAACEELAKSSTEKCAVRAVNLSKNVGAAEARNAGIDASRAEFITFVDADDAISEDYLAEISNQISANGNADIFVFGAHEEHFQGDKKTATAEFIPKAGHFSTKEEILKAAAELEADTLFGYVWNKVYRRDLIVQNEVRFPSFRLYEDTHFNIRVWKNAECVICIDKALYNYRREENASVTHGFIADYWDLSYGKVMSMWEWFLEENALTHEAKTVLANEYVRYAFSAVWRNRDPRSGMSAADQKKWVENFYSLPLTKQLLDFAKPQGRVAAKMAKTLQSRNVNKVLRTARIIDFVTNHMRGLLTHLRQSR